MQYEVEVNGRVRQVSVHRLDRRFVVSLDGRDRIVDAVRVDPYTLSLLIDRVGMPLDHAAGMLADTEPDPAAAPPVASHEVTLATDAASGRIAVTVGAVPLTLTLNGRRRWGRRDEGAPGPGGPQQVVAPMPGKVVRLLVTPGQAVKKGQPLVVVEAMKMENELRASGDGVVIKVQVQEGQSVDAGAVLVVVGPA